MIVATSRAHVILAPGQVSRLNLSAGTRLRGVAGTTWVTIDNDLRDIVLERSEEWLLDKDVHVMATALPGNRSAEIQIEEPLHALSGLPEAVTA